ncbi:MAG: FHA domain-containing protein [Planctomycetes bacterium]|nr:FHA domain-containing protein [Planctomycetota bacterium]
MSLEANGELVPMGGGDAIPLIRDTLTMGRRESCDICLRFPNVSGMHCELTFHAGYWRIRDLGSTNGIKVNDSRIHTRTVLHPKDKITIAKRSYIIEYEQPIGKQAMDEMLEDAEEIMDQPLLEKAGLIHPPREVKRPLVSKPRNINRWEEIIKEETKE